MVILVIIICFVLLFFVFQKMGSSFSNNTWDKFLSMSNLDEIGKAYDFEIFRYIISTIFKPLQINSNVFLSNLIYLTYEGHQPSIMMREEGRLYRIYSQSIKDFGLSFNRPPLWPIWFIAAFPDIVKWQNESDLESNILFSNIDMDSLRQAKEMGFSHESDIDLFKKVILNYNLYVTKKLETSFK